MITPEIRRRSWRVQVLQDRVDGMIAFSAARAAEYAEGNPAAATGLLVKDYRGKDANQVVWKFDSALESKIMEALKQAAIEEGQGSDKRDLSGGVSMDIIRERLNAGRQRVADFKKARDAKAAAALDPATKP